MGLFNTYKKILFESLLKEEDDGLQHIKQLFDTRDSDNIELALMLAKSQNIDITSVAEEIQQKAFFATELKIEDIILALKLVNAGYDTILNDLDKARMFQYITKDWQVFMSRPPMDLESDRNEARESGKYFSLAHKLMSILKIFNSLEVVERGNFHLYIKTSFIGHYPYYTLHDIRDDRLYHVMDARSGGVEINTEDYFKFFGAFYPHLGILKKVGSNTPEIYTDGLKYYWVDEKDLYSMAKGDYELIKIGSFHTYGYGGDNPQDMIHITPKKFNSQDLEELFYYEDEAHFGEFVSDVSQKIFQKLSNS